MGAIDILVGTGELIHGAVLVDSRTREAFGPVFDNEADARGFLEWLGDDPRDTREGVDHFAKRWRIERDWQPCKCGDGMRVEPGNDVCENCQCDLDYEAEQAAKGKEEA